jgi:hypothetical protein
VLCYHSIHTSYKCTTVSQNQMVINCTSNRACTAQIVAKARSICKKNVVCKVSQVALFHLLQSITIPRLAEHTTWPYFTSFDALLGLVLPKEAWHTTFNPPQRPQPCVHRDLAPCMTQPNDTEESVGMPHQLRLAHASACHHRAYGVCHSR